MSPIERLSKLMNDESMTEEQKIEESAKIFIDLKPGDINSLFEIGIFRKKAMLYMEMIEEYPSARGHTLDMLKNIASSAKDY